MTRVMDQDKLKIVPMT